MLIYFVVSRNRYLLQRDDGKMERVTRMVDATAFRSREDAERAADAMPEKWWKGGVRINEWTDAEYRAVQAEYGPV